MQILFRESNKYSNLITVTLLKMQSGM